jgi:hypothetical protein
MNTGQDGMILGRNEVIVSVLLASQVHNVNLCTTKEAKKTEKNR